MAHRPFVDYCPILERAGSVRDRLLRAALEELDHAGTGRVSLRAIARRVGVSHQAVAHYFPGRSALFEQLAVDTMAALERQCADAVAAEPDRPEELIVELAEIYLEFAAVRPALFDLTHGGGSGLITPTASAVAEARQRLWQQLVAVVRQASETGWGGGTPAEALALMCLSTVHGLAALRRDGTIPVEVDDLSPLIRQSVAALGTRTGLEA